MIIKYIFNIYVGRFIKWFIFLRVFRSFIKEQPPIKEGVMDDMKGAFIVSISIEIIYFIKEILWN